LPIANYSLFANNFRNLSRQRFVSSENQNQSAIGNRQSAIN